MGKVTRIEQQAKREHRFSVYVDGRYAFSLARDQLSEAGLKVGQELGESDISRLKGASGYGKLRDLTYNWLGLRPRSEGEIDEYLQRKTDDEGLREKLKSELKSYNYIDDEKFAGSWIAARRSTRPLSKYRLKQELVKKRVPREIIDEQLAAAGPDDLTAAREIIKRRAHRYRDKQKLMAYLSRQGFGYDTIKRALED